VTDAARVAAIAEELDVTLVINNAGIGRPATALNATIEDARAELETNYLSIVSTTTAFAPVLAARGGGAFVNVLSVASWAAFPRLATYSASKSAAWGYTNAARIALKAQGTQVVGVHVGFVDTDLAAAITTPKVPPQAVAAAALDALESGAPEALVDDAARNVKAGLAADMDLIYPELEREFAAAA
jgi:short-subunit dehydrogenase